MNASIDYIESNVSSPLVYILSRLLHFVYNTHGVVLELLLLLLYGYTGLLLVYILYSVYIKHS